MLQTEVLSNTMTVTSLQYINISHQYVVHYKFTEYYVNYSSIKLEKVKYNINKLKERKPILILRKYTHNISLLAIFRLYQMKPMMCPMRFGKFYSNSTSEHWSAYQTNQITCVLEKR